MDKLTVSCVLFQQCPVALTLILESIEASVGDNSFVAYFVDNSPDEALKGMIESHAWAKYIKNPSGNTGFAQGHNLMLNYSEDYHLVLNPDVEMAPDSLVNALNFMEKHPECGLLVPETYNGQGTKEYLCRRYPTVLDLVLRGFAPLWIKRLCRARLGRYEMRDLINDEVLWDPPLVSGCFMLFRSSVLRQLGGFDAAFFLYFEDYDISLRTAKISRIAYVPTVKIVHYGGGAARKGLRHVCLFAQSAITFFNKHGWRFV